MTLSEAWGYEGMREYLTEKCPRGGFARREKTAGGRSPAAKILISALIGAVCAGLLFGCGGKAPAEDTGGGGRIMVYNGETVTSDEFRLFMLLSQQDGKDAALDFLLYALAVINRAREDGITLGEEDDSAVRRNIETLAVMTTGEGAVMAPFDIPGPRLYDLMATDAYARRLYDIYTGDMEIADTADFEAEFDRYYEEGRAYYTELTFNYIYTATEEDAAEALEAAKKDPDGFGDAVKRFSLDYNGEAGVETVDLREVAVDETTAAALLETPVGEITEALPFGDGFVIAKPVTNRRPPKDEVEADFRNMYLESRKYERFSTLVDEWRALGDYEIDQKAFDAFVMEQPD
jgi:parvulin-like peptidyl-prolyl isomerase